MRSIEALLVVAVAALAACAAGAGRAASPDMEAPSALPAEASAAAWQRLQGLAGTWRGEAEGGRVIELRYELIARGSALAETYTTASGTTTMTLYHPDGPRLMATHYCAQGNQPRLVATRYDEASSLLVLELMDGTNLVDPDAAHMTRLAFTFMDDAAFVQESTYEQGAESESESVVFRRSEP